MMRDRIERTVGDITTLDVDAIVNAANQKMLGGGGVDGAIHRAAGPRLRQACEAVEPVEGDVRCPTGEARITPGFDLPAKFVIHTVGPVYSRSNPKVADQLAACYENALKLAEENDVDSIAFPAISTGVYGYPKDEAASIAVNVARRWVKQHNKPGRIVFCCFSDADAKFYREAGLTD